MSLGAVGTVFLTAERKSKLPVGGRLQIVKIVGVSVGKYIGRLHPLAEPASSNNGTY